MGAQFAPIAVDLAQVRKVVGSKSRTLLPKLRKFYRPWFETVAEQMADAGGPSLEDALKRLIAGKEPDPAWPFPFAVAVEVLYRLYGVMLSAHHFSSMRMEWAFRVDEGIKRAGVPEERFGLLRHLFERGPAIPFPGRMTMCMGYLSLAEARSAMEAFARADYTSLKPDVRQAVAEVRTWLVSCDTLGCDLVGFYSDGA